VRLISIKLIIRALLVSVFLHPFFVSAATCGVSFKSDATKHILFVNGIKNERLGACTSSDRLNVSYFHNPTNGLWGGSDIAELAVQAGFSDAASVENTPFGTRDQYYKILGQRYKTYILLNPNQEMAKTTKKLYDRVIDLIETKGRDLVLVPHSQGNFYVEAVYGMLVANNRSDILTKIKVVGIASVANFPPGDYVTLTQDVAVNNLQVANASVLGNTGVYKPALPLVSGCLTLTANSCKDSSPSSSVAIASWHNDVLVHSVTDTYLRKNFLVDTISKEAIPEKISKLVGNALAQFTTTITDFQPRSVTAYTSTVFTVTGTKLPTTPLVVSGLCGGSNIVFLSQSTSEHKFSCAANPAVSTTVTVELRESANAPVLKSYPIQVTVLPAPTMWRAWNNSIYSPAGVSSVGGVISTTNGLGNLQVRLSSPISGDNFRIEFEARSTACDGIGCDFAFVIGNTFLSGVVTNNVEQPTKQVSFSYRFSPWPDVTTVVSSGGTQSILQPGHTNGTGWRLWAVVVTPGLAKYYADGVLLYSVLFIGNIGQLDTLYFVGRTNVEVRESSIKFTPP
jgi:hypothetical protein